MKIAVVCPYDLGLPGGVQQVAIELVDRLIALDHDAWLVGPGDRVGARGVGSTVRIRANASVAPIALGPSVASAVRRAIAGADVVHIHEPLMPAVSTAALKSSLPKVLTFHADAPAWVERVYRRLPAKTTRRIGASVVTAVSPVAAAALPTSFGQIEIIPNGIEAGAFDRPGRLPNRVTFLGRDEPRKGLGLLLDAWPGIRARIPDAELVVMGAVRSDAPDGVRFMGRVDEETKRAVLASSTVHVAPNTGGESFGIVVAEAMAAGAAVVASDIPAFGAVIGGTGVQVPVGDRVGLSDAVAGLLENPERASRIGRSGQERARQYDWTVVVDRYTQAYRRALA